MAGSAHLPFLQETIILLTTAGIVVPLLGRLKLSPVLTYLLVGALVGPFGLVLLSGPESWLRYATIGSVDQVKALAELGIIFLLFVIGLELSPKKLWALRKQVFGIGTLQVLISGGIIGLIAASFGNSLQNSVLLGACLALSSTAIVMQLLAEKRQLASNTGRHSFAILLFQDIAVVPILVLVGVFSAGADADVMGLLGAALGKAVVAVLGIGLTGYFLLRPLFRLASGAIGAEAFFAVALLVAIGTAALTGLAGLSMALGAFLAGLLLAETEYSHAIETYIAPFKGLLLGLFFMSVGMSLDVRAVLGDWLILSLSVIGIILIKATVIYLLLRLSGQSRATALECGLLLGQAGEFAFVIVGMAVSLGLMTGQVGQFMLLVAVLSMLITPLVATLAHRLSQTLRGNAAPSLMGGDLDGLNGHIIIVSYGRVGQLLGQVFDREGLPWVAIDRDAAVVSTARSQGKPVYFGDITHAGMLAHLAPATAQAVVLALNEGKPAAQVLAHLRSHFPELPVFVRARDLASLALLRAAGASGVVPDTVEAGLQLAGRVLTGLGLADDEVIHRLDLLRTELVPQG
jgi:monovalent cation:proton antiporter-2 (CPA2) family protein